MVLVALDPDLEEERRRFVSPVVRGVVGLGARWQVWLGWGMKVLVVGVVAGAGVAVWLGIRVEGKGEEEEEAVEEENDGVSEGGEGMKDNDDDETPAVEK